jgi:hypothetical protein
MFDTKLHLELEWKGKININKSKCPQNNRKKGEYDVLRDKIDHVNIAKTPIITAKIHC